MITGYTHPKDCADHKAAAADRKEHAATASQRQAEYQLLAHAAWFDWYASQPQVPSRRIPARESEQAGS
jgi:hypothetical protein